MRGSGDGVRRLAIIAVIAVAAATVMAVVPAALAQADNTPGAMSSTGPGLELLANCKSNVGVSLVASPEPATLLLRATGAVGDVSFSFKVLRVLGGTASMLLDDHGNATAALIVDRSTPASLIFEATTIDSVGEGRGVYRLDILSGPSDMDDTPGIDVLVGGLPAKPLVELTQSTAPARMELRTTGHGADDAPMSLRVLWSAHWGTAADGGGVLPTVTNHGCGRATMVADRSVPGAWLVEVSSVGPGGTVRELYLLHVLPTALANYARPAGAEWLPDSIPGAPFLPRLLDQARLDMCADTPHTEDTWGVDSHNHWNVYKFDWKENPAMSGVPPIEGTSSKEAGIVYPDGNEVPFGGSERWWWGCQTRASFGTQVPQWIILCDVPGDGRSHYYIRNLNHGDLAAADQLINPYTGNQSEFSSSYSRTYAAAPGPQWTRLRHDDSALMKFDPYEPVGPNAHVAVTELFVKTSKGFNIITTRVEGTYSSVPELLPFSGKLVFRATAFHADDVTFQIAASDRTLDALVGTPHALVNGTEVPITAKSGKHLSWYNRISVSVHVSDIAKDNGILIEGINGDGNTDGYVVKRLHDITLVAEIPMSVHSYNYEPINPAFAIEPWGCWPLLNGTAWAP